MFNCRSLGEKVRKLGIPIVAACNCCRLRIVEDLNHVLGRGEFAVTVWQKVSAEVGVYFDVRQSWKERVQPWFNRCVGKSQLGSLMGLIPCIVVWRLWRRCCVARMEGRSETVLDVWGLVLALDENIGW